MKKSDVNLTGCRSKLLGATILGDLLCESPIYLLNTSCSCGELNAAIRLGSRLTCVTKKIIKYLLYSISFLNSSSNSLLRA